ncbi:hypothetical protein [Microvirga alba]|uniref:Uncharacterized protein n=1 Tax=Microvirga alba TaxID=2791025 RepID=A0A931BMB7_9HYPH|nr:hypothetical protein [Microvirga alba]MBF9231960.1 hypothetical protein [Microvirga alba]
MARAPILLIGLAGAAFLAGGLVPGDLTIETPAQARGATQRAAEPQSGDIVKSNRISGPSPARDRTSVSTVELVGLSKVTVILRDETGTILYSSDPRTGTTVLAKDTELPVITLKEEMRGPPVQLPVTRREGSDTPSQGPVNKPRYPVGCVTDVSSLVRASADRAPSLCLAYLDQSLL